MITPIKSIIDILESRTERITAQTSRFAQSVSNRESEFSTRAVIRATQGERLSCLSNILLKTINTIIKLFNDRFEKIDFLLLSSKRLDEYLHTYNYITKINRDPLFISKFFIGQHKTINSVHTKTLVNSFKTNQLAAAIDLLQETISSQNDEYICKRFKSLPFQFQTIIKNSLFLYFQENEPLEPFSMQNHHISLLLKKVSTICNAEGENIFEQIVKMLHRKHSLLEEKAILYKIETLLDSEEVNEDEMTKEIKELSAHTNTLLGEDLFKFPLHKETIINEVIRVKNSIEKTINSIDRAFVDLSITSYKKLSIYEVSSEKLTETISSSVLQTPIHVTMIGIEYAEFVKEGGLAEAIEGMVKGMKAQHPANRVRLIFPRFSILPSHIQSQIENTVPLSLKDSQGNSFWYYRLEIEGIECYFIDHPTFQLSGEKPSIYGPDAESVGIRCTIFSGLAADLLMQIEKSDVIHLHDWHVAAIAHKLKVIHKKEWEAGEIPPIVFTYHNNNRAAQGRLQQGIYNYSPVIKSVVDSQTGKSEANIFVQTLKDCDAVTTVSEAFAIESQQLNIGGGVSFAVRKAAAQGKLTGVINGSNPNRWNPETDLQLQKWKDPFTEEPVDLRFAPHKPIYESQQLCKAQLGKWIKTYKSNVTFDASKPYVTYVGRFDSTQKGLDKLEEAIKATLNAGGQFICMGSMPDPTVDKLLDRLEKTYKKGVLFIRDYKDKETGRLHYQQGSPSLPGIGSIVRAASEFIYVPSSFEPCGLVQFEGWLFGSLVIGSNVGGLAETIIDREKGANRFNGFLFERESNGNKSARAVIQSAFSVWNRLDNVQREQLQRRLMAEGRNYSWTSSPTGLSPVEKYRLVYENAKRYVRFRSKCSRTPSVNLLSNLRKIHPEKLSPHAFKANKLTKLEEKYLELYHHSNASSKNLESLYKKMPINLKRTVPSPYGKKVNFQRYQEFGAHHSNGKTTFKVQAFNARTVSLRLISTQGKEIFLTPITHDKGCWTFESNEAPPGTKYQYIINGKEKIDPYGKLQALPHSHSTAPFSVVTDSIPYQWEDQEWMKAKIISAGKSKPISIYELHPSIWKKKDGHPLNYRELAQEIIQHCQQVGYTHVELMGVLEHPYEPSLGYQVSGFFAPNSRLGSIDDFKYLINEIHKHNIGVILDWIPAHFAKDTYSLSNFDETSQFETSGIALLTSLRYWFFNWGTKFFDYSKEHVREFLISSAAYWVKEMHIDGLRVDAVNCILHSEKPQASKLFLKDLNHIIHAQFPGTLMIAEDYSNTIETTRPFYQEGLGFDMKWNIAWMKQTFNYFSQPFDSRKDHYKKLVAAIENDRFHKMIMALSHDEVKKGMRGLINLTPSLEEEIKLANLRAMLSYMMCAPGKKLLFMGSDVGSTDDWIELIGTSDGLMRDEQTMRQSAQETMACLKYLNELYQHSKPLYEQDSNGHDLLWIEKNDPTGRIHAYRRVSNEGNSFACIHNFSNEEVQEFRVDIPHAVLAAENIIPEELFNSDDVRFGGKGQSAQIHPLYNDQNRLIAYTVRVPRLTTLIISEKNLKIDIKNNL